MPRSEMDVCEFLSGFLPEEVDDELLAYAARKYCKPDPVTKYKQPARRFYLEERLRSLKMREDEGFGDFLGLKFMPLYEALADMGRKVDDETLVFLLLSALPDSWSGFVEVVVLLGLDMLSLDDLCLKIEIEEMEGEIRADNRHVIKRLGLRKYVQLRDLREGGKVKDIREEIERLSAKASKLPIQGASAGSKQSRKTRSSNRNEEPEEEWILGSSLTFVDTNETVTPRGVHDTRAQQQQPRSSSRPSNRKHEANQAAQRSVQGTRSHPQGSRSVDNRKNEEPEELWICGSSLTFEDANGRSIPQAGTQSWSQPQNPRANGNRQNKKKAKEVWVTRVEGPY